MVVFHQAFLVLTCAAVTVSYPLTCYTKVLLMGREITERATEIRRNPATELCTAHLPAMYVDVHNACVMQRMRTYVYLLDSLRDRRCAYNRVVQAQSATIRQLYHIMANRCHGDLLFSLDDCAALDLKAHPAV